ncbi:MAG: hypothetical protein HY975_04430 [Candidatus Kerfeldbacteria bacterium]|nr:hypothetical protein [Candidatus Kerfeldbacteria bacterium]
MDATLQTETYDGYTSSVYYEDHQFAEPVTLTYGYRYDSDGSVRSYLLPWHGSVSIIGLIRAEAFLAKYRTPVPADVRLSF